MKIIPIAGALALGLSLSACATSGLKPDQALTLLDGMHKAGCGGSFGVHGGASTGQLGGQASINVDINATCPTAGQPASDPAAPAAPAK